jgi:dTDP-glucose 4,6-dehydratase
MVTNALEGKPLPVYGDGMQVRDWIHVDDHGRGLLAVLERGKLGEIYNLGGDSERPNLWVVRKILETLGLDDSLLRYVPDRPAHDRRYAMDFSKIERNLGWRPLVPFEEGLRRTVAWYRDHAEWWRRVKSGAYLRYYEDQYGARLRAGRS